MWLRPAEPDPVKTGVGRDGLSKAIRPSSAMRDEEEDGLPMDTISVLTLRLSEAIGLYMIVVGIGGLTAPQRWRAMMEDLERSPGLVMALGFPVFAVGAALILIHSIWTDPLAVIVSLIGYVALVEGALLLAVPGPLIRIGRWSVQFTRAWAIVSIVLGILLFLAGLTGRATVIA